MWDVEVNGQVVPMIQTGLTAYGRFVDPQDPTVETLANVRLSDPVTRPTWRLQNYLDVIQLNGLGRSLTNTMLITILWCWASWSPRCWAAMPSHACAFRAAMWSSSSTSAQ